MAQQLPLQAAPQPPPQPASAPVAVVQAAPQLLQAQAVRPQVVTQVLAQRDGVQAAASELAGAARALASVTAAEQRRQIEEPVRTAAGELRGALAAITEVLRKDAAPSKSRRKAAAHNSEDEDEPSPRARKLTHNMYVPSNKAAEWGGTCLRAARKFPGGGDDFRRSGKWK